MRYFIVLFILTLELFAKVITFSPLPMDKAPKLYTHYNDMLQYLEKETGYKFKFIYSSSYEELIKNFKAGKIDIIELGALPYVRLRDTYEDTYPFLTFKSQDGKPYYTCDLITTEKNIKNFEDIKHTNDVILTRSLSTCGYLMSEYMMNEKNDTLENFKYEYAGTHSNVLLNLLLKENTIGTLKSTVLNKYIHFDFQTLAKSPNIPGFAFIANTNTLELNKINKIKNAIIKLNPLDNEKDKEIVSKWSVNTKYGAVPTEEKTYDIVIESLKKIQIPKAKNNEKF